LLAIMALSWIYVLYGNLAPVAGLFFGLKAAVLAIVFQAVVRIGSRALDGTARRAVAAGAFVALFLFKVPFPLIIVSAGAIGYLATRTGSTVFTGSRHTSAGGNFGDNESALGSGLPEHAVQGGRRTIVIGLILLLLWLGPLALLAKLLGPDSSFTAIGIFFAKMAIVTFGGAYAVLSYVAQEAVQTYHWLTPTEMLDGLGLAETTPGPLIMVTQFVGFLGAYRNPGTLPPLIAGTLGGLLTTWATFIPCFLWIFVCAPFVERLRNNRALAAALAAVTAAVVGVILNLACWFALHFLFGRVALLKLGPVSLDVPDPASIDPLALFLSVSALIVTFRFKPNLLWLLAGYAAAGLLMRLALH
jgi:chromate transporter